MNIKKGLVFFSFGLMFGACHHPDIPPPTGEQFPYQAFVDTTYQVNTMVFSHDGTKILTSSVDGTAKIWNVATGKIETTFVGHLGEVNTAVWSPLEDQVLTASKDGTIRVWEAKSGHEVTTLSTASLRNCWFAMFTFDTSQVISVCEDRIPDPSDMHMPPKLIERSFTILWDVKAAKDIERWLDLPVHPQGIESRFNLSADGSKLMLSDRTAGIYIVDLQKDMTLMTTDPGQQEAAFSSDGKTLFAVSGIGNNPKFNLTAWNIADGKLIYQKPLPYDNSSSIDIHFPIFSSDGSRLAFGIGMPVTAPPSVLTPVLETTMGNQISTLQGISSWGGPIVFSNNAQKLIMDVWEDAEGRRESLHLWDVATGQEVKTIFRYYADGPIDSSAINAYAVSPDDSKLAIADVNGNILILPL